MRWECEMGRIDCPREIKDFPKTRATRGSKGEQETQQRLTIIDGAAMEMSLGLEIAWDNISDEEVAANSIYTDDGWPHGRRFMLMFIQKAEQKSRMAAGKQIVTWAAPAKIHHIADNDGTARIKPCRGLHILCRASIVMVPSACGKSA